LHHEPGGALVNIKLVGDESTKGLHADVDTGVKDPQQARGHPQDRRVRHEEERNAGQDRAYQEIRTTTSESVPRPIAHRTNDGLYQQSGHWTSKPKQWHVVRAGAEVGIDAAHIRELQTPAKLDSHESETHVPHLPKA
jgi:hypothetical protein